MNEQVGGMCIALRNGIRYQFAVAFAEVQRYSNFGKFGYFLFKAVFHVRMYCKRSGLDNFVK